MFIAFMCAVYLPDMHVVTLVGVIDVFVVKNYVRYLDMLPTTFGNPLWFSDSELLELKGTTLYRATELQVKGFELIFTPVEKNSKKVFYLGYNKVCSIIQSVAVRKRQRSPWLMVLKSFTFL